MTFTKFQQDIIKSIISYAPDMLEIKFKELFEFLMNKHFKNIGCELFEDKFVLKFDINFDSKKIIEEKNRFIDFLFLIEILEKNFNFFYNSKKQKKYSFGSIKETKTIIIKNIKTKILLNNLDSDYYISSALKELKELNFRSIEYNNLHITALALVFSIIATIISIILECYNIFSNKEKEIKEFINYIIYIK